MERKGILALGVLGGKGRRMEENGGEWVCDLMDGWRSDDMGIGGWE